MSRPNRQSIASRLTRMNLVVCGTALLLAYISFVFYDLFSLRQGLRAELDTEAQIIGSNCVAALAWIRNNISQFGGDPGNVTIFGESGGGGKVSTLLAMPAATGLFHRAIIQSGAAVRLRSRERALKLTELVIKELGITTPTIEQLRSVPVARLLAAIKPAERALGPS